jgi:integrase/recombinase XerD
VNGELAIPVGPDDSDAAADPLAALVLGWLASKRSVHTRRAYGRDVGSWLTWCTSHHIEPLAATEPLVASWARRLEADGLAASTVARKLAAVSSWYTWLSRTGHARGNPAEHLARPEVDRDTSATAGLTRDQALALLAAADQDHGSQRLRTAALVAVILYTGARVSEVVGAAVEDLGADRGHRVLRVTRKGGKRQALVMPSPAATRLDAYLVTRSDLGQLPALPGQPGGPQPRRTLFATESGGRLFAPDVWALIRRLARAAGLPADLVSHLGVHSLRHSYATLYLDAGGSLRDLQDAMGHADPRTTRRYDRARYSLDRSPGYALASYLATAE